MLCNKAQFFVFFEVCLNPHLFTSLRTVFNTQKHTKTKWLSGTCVPSLLKEQRHRVTTPVKNRLTINHASEITLLLVSLTAIYVRQKIEGFLRRQEFILKSDKILYRHYILSMPALFYAESTELLAKSCILVYY